MKVLVLGSGAREHALCWRLGLDRDVSQVVCAPGNAGIARSIDVAPVVPTDPDAVLGHRTSTQCHSDSWYAGQEVTVVTNAPAIAIALAEHAGLEVIVIGGRLDTRARVTVGTAAVGAIRAIRADACVLGVCALHPEAGLGTDDLEEAAVGGP